MSFNAAGRSPTSRAAGQHEHVLLVSHHYEPESGAPQRRWAALVPRFVHAGVRVSVLAPPPHYPDGRVDPEHADARPGTVQDGLHGEQVFRVRFRAHSTSLVSRTADQVIAAAHSVVVGWRHLRAPGERPTVVVATVPGIPSMFAAWVLARLFRACLVVEMRDAWPDLIRPAGLLARGPGQHLRAALVATVHRTIVRMQVCSDLVVTTTETFAAVVARRGAAHVGVVRNGTSFVDLQARRRDPATSTAELLRLGVSRPLRVVYAGTIGRSQGLEVVVRAAADLERRGVPVEVRMAGSGTDVPQLTRLASVLGAPVTFVGRVPHDDVPALYTWSDTVVVSLRDWEPFEWTVPSKLYEAMATGRHVTACLAGEAAELVGSLAGGDVVPPGDVGALTALWARFVAEGAVPVPAPAARDWVTVNADDDALAAHYLDLLGGLRR